MEPEKLIVECQGRLMKCFYHLNENQPEKMWESFCDVIKLIAAECPIDEFDKHLSKYLDDFLNQKLRSYSPSDN